MKNMFKMMGVALLAGAMLFTACKKDETTSTSAAGAPVAEEITVTFDGSTWTPNYYTCNYNAETSLIDIQAYKNQNNVPILNLAFDKKERSYSVTIQSVEQTDDQGAYYEITGYNKENVKAIKYWESADQDTYDWWAQSATLEVTEFDPTNMRVSVNVDALMFDYAGWSGEIRPESSTVTRQMSVRIKNLNLSNK